MKIALVNPFWTYDDSIYFGCRQPHLPLELGYSKALLEAAGHEVLMLDGQLQKLDNSGLCERVADFAPAMTVVSTAPTYLFWRCAPPELRVPADFLNLLAGRGGRTVAVGPHGSATPAPTLRKLGVDIVVRGECEEVVEQLARRDDWSAVPSTAYLRDARVVSNGGVHASSFVDHPPLEWPADWIAAHSHHHHRFDDNQVGFGAEVEASRGCPYNCSFCAKIDFRDAYRRRNHEAVVAEIDRLIAQGVGYIYFIDEIFLPQKALLEALVDRNVKFGVQTRIDLWKPELLELLGAAGCVSIEAGLESLTVEGRAMLAKRCRLGTEELAALLVDARRHVPFVQANLIGVVEDDPALVERWRTHLIDHGVWANEPVPLYPYPSSPSYRELWGEPDDLAWERAHDHYLASFQKFSDIQEKRPRPLAELEATCCGH
ncbi:TIGR04295 family B12-binding domain-containing radical SAM protein [Mesorhizobium sp. M7A.F.Ca.US.014.04.1.1]|uniref:TIGR04295 family B12-binding domain-containing radical SAM protein n=2 Tax=Phyllobacteriaceae TaxID=69277 RepID=UPI0007A958EA|nr:MULTISPECIES: TIGR04295 family B12-binding domain-containing radical SAM protein [Mesorhizobium]AMX96936.1 B12-binding domain-containing radical SAM protein [Mesorhizobium ciceri]ARP67062.1 B12-binding domain/radical SAM domain-containing protein [Mesorhizobium sp. WSM1497]MDF3206180.1 TIGR04295 family B12-binding domain-containing radical SAM protein [Mesorhizobium sp. LMG15046]MDF3229745.1 TIGR04295 family B12-binding domain-containing radical SAM protein [Mesorhizobium sp. DSM 30133]RUU2